MNDLNLYTYRATYVGLYDGDTWEIVPDLGFGISFDMPGESNWRLKGWDTPELRGGSDHEKAKAREAKKFVEEWFLGHSDVHQVIVRTYRYEQTDSLNRWLADVWAANKDGEIVSHLGTELADRGLATMWPTRWREVYDA